MAFYICSMLFVFALLTNYLVDFNDFVFATTVQFHVVFSKRNSTLGFRNISKAESGENSTLGIEYGRSGFGGYLGNVGSTGIFGLFI